MDAYLQDLRSLVLVAAPAFLLVVDGLASYLPARRATAVGPMIALRTD